jgi:hypothetical protein
VLVEVMKPAAQRIYGGVKLAVVTAFARLPAVDHHVLWGTGILLAYTPEVVVTCARYGCGPVYAEIAHL